MPVGASVKLDGSLEQFVVGRDGLAYIEDLQEKNMIVVSWPENECRVVVPYSVDEGV
ncbi:MAG: FimD/PapC C-terminal domain-containing protein, partial [Burkholderiaceae bacterium]